MLRFTSRRVCSAAAGAAGAAAADTTSTDASAASGSAAAAGGGSSAGPSGTPGRTKPMAGPGSWRDPGVFVEQPAFYSKFFEDDDTKKAEFGKKKPPLKSFEELMEMDVEKLKKLHDIRTQQIQELKMLHERSHRNVEYYYRKQALEYDEKALNYGEAAGSLAMDQISYHRRRLGEVREKNWVEDREKVLVLWICFFVPLGWWCWMMTHYPKKPTIDNKGTLTSSWRAWTNPMSTDNRWIGKNVLTAWEKERLEKEDPTITFKTHGDGSVMQYGAGFTAKVRHAAPRAALEDEAVRRGEEELKRQLNKTPTPPTPPPTPSDSA